MAALGLSNSILADLVEQRFVADLQNGCRLFAIPVCLLERLCDRERLSFILRRTGERLQTTAIVLG